MKATKKPVTIDYIPYEDDYLPISQWVYDMVDTFSDHFITYFKDGELVLKVRTLEGTSYEVTTDDMIIRGVNGEYYPCKKDIFFKTYDVCAH